MTSLPPFAEALWADVSAVRQKTPLVHNITNLVVMSYNANVLLALGAAPVMAHAREEAADMARIADALVLNIGTLQPEWVESMKLAAQAAHAHAIPVVLDPVGAGATPYRNSVIRELLSTAKPDILRGNASEIMSVAGQTAPTKGVESTRSSDHAVQVARQLAKTLHKTVCVSGETDYILDQDGRQISLSNGHIWMTRITGTGCSASAMIGAFAAVEPDHWRATVAATAYLGVAGELAAEQVITQKQGVGSLQIALLDQLQLMTEEAFLSRLKIAGDV